MIKDPNKIIKENIAHYDSGKGVLDTVIPEEDYIRKEFGEDVPSSWIFLDCACGMGVHLMSVNCRRIGLDISIENLIKGKKLGRETDFIVGNAESLPLIDASIDAVLLVSALHHFPTYENCIKEVGRVLKGGGKIYIAEANSIGLLPYRILLWPFNLIRKMRGTYPAHEVHAGKISLVRIKRLLEKYGFCIEKVQGNSTFIGAFHNLFVKYIPGFKRLTMLNKVIGTIDSSLSRLLPVFLKRFFRMVAIKT